MNKQKFNKTIFNCLEQWQKMSKCVNTHVAACICEKEKPLSFGYNGEPSGFTDCCDVFMKRDGNFYINVNIPDIADWLNEKGLSIPDNPDSDGWINLSSITDESETVFNWLHFMWSEKYTIHAEMNCILNLIKQQSEIQHIDNATFYVTHSPCKQCMKNIAALGIKNIIYRERYWRDTEENLNKAAKSFGLNLSKFLE